MIITARIERDKLIFFDAKNGAVKTSVTLPSNCTYTGPVISGNSVTVSVHFKNGSNRSMTYNLKTGQIISDIQM